MTLSKEENEIPKNKVTRALLFGMHKFFGNREATEEDYLAAEKRIFFESEVRKLRKRLGMVAEDERSPFETIRALQTRQTLGDQK